MIICDIINQTFTDLTFLYKRLLRVLIFIFFKKSPDFPIFFQIQTINQCNGSCDMCPMRFNKGKKTKKISNELFENIIREISAEGGIRHIVLHLQNEPLLDNDIFRKIQLIRRIGKGHITTFFATNGSLFSKEKLSQLVDSGLDELVISLDACSEESYNKIRKGLNFNIVLKNIKMISKSKYDGNLSVGFVKQKENIMELNDFEKMCKKMKINKKVSKICNRSGDLDDFENYRIKKKNMSIYERISSYLMKRVIKVCPFTINWMTILHNGDVIVCCNDYRKKIIIGNLNKSTIKEIWKNKRLEKIRLLQLQKKYKEISICKKCSFFDMIFN